MTNPIILIIDEATTNIDMETEALIQEGLSKMCKGRTTVVIAYLLSVIHDVDLILILKYGVIFDRGTHEEQLSQMGIYYGIYELQKRGVSE